MEQETIHNKIFSKYYQNPKFFKLEEISNLVDEFIKEEDLIVAGKGKNRYKVYNIPVCFDIETTSFEIDDTKYNTMYSWQICINGAIVLGRNWRDFEFFMTTLSNILELSTHKRLRVYVHNLAYEFQYIQHQFGWQDVFASEMKRPLKALSTSGFEFACSYRLAGYSLEKVGENLLKYKCNKLSGEEFDYSKIRHSKTELTEKELEYCWTDVLVGCCFIQEEIERNDNRISNIPLTFTGYARRLCREFCFGKTKTSKKNYQEFIKNFTIEEEEYDWLKKAFQGGFTHANAKYACSYAYVEHCLNVFNHIITSYDFSSSYPAVLVSEMYPMSKGQKIEVSSKEELLELFKKYLCVFPIIFNNIKSKCNADHPLSLSKCYGYDDKKILTENGRIVEADRVGTYINNIDYDVINLFYDFDSVDVREVYIYKKSYLPKGFIEAVSYLYEAKTSLKGVKGKEEEYQHGKSLLNALFGMCCMAIVRDEVDYSVFNEDWQHVREEFGDVRQLSEYNNSDSRFLHYSWGVFCTSYARRNLLFSIYNVGEDDYVYSDTDSMKIFNVDKHIDYINKYNELITKKVKLCLKYYNMPEDTFEPETIDHIKKPIGVWDFDGQYEYFKTLGAKRYMYVHDDVLNITVSGINKKKCVPFLLEQHNLEYTQDKKTKEYHIKDFNTEKVQNEIYKIFREFNTEMEIPARYAGKTVSTYIDDEFEVELTDYKGKTINVHEHGCIWMGESDYKLKIGDDLNYYIDYVLERIVYKSTLKLKKAS